MINNFVSKIVYSINVYNNSTKYYTLSNCKNFNKSTFTFTLNFNLIFHNGIVINIGLKFVIIYN